MFLHKKERPKPLFFMLDDMRKYFENTDTMNQVMLFWLVTLIL